MGTRVRATKAENSTIARSARHAIAKSPLDISELSITCGEGGQIELFGKVKLPRGYAGAMDVRKELENLKNMIMTTRGVKVVNASRVKIF